MAKIVTAQHTITLSQIVRDTDDTTAIPGLSPDSLDAIRDAVASMLDNPLIVVEVA